ncbi:MAG TPA: hypothetical protein VMZ28_03595 [Kofleriaceae bacterium]|nr:hypothetical protein [Kofleriaceae bacterium]
MTPLAARLALVCTLLGAAAPAEAGQTVAVRGAGRPVQAKTTRAPRLRKVVSFPLRVVKEVWNVDEHITHGYHAAKAAKRRAADRRAARKIDARVKSGARPTPGRAIQIGRARKTDIAFGDAELGALDSLADSLIGSSDGLTGLEDTVSADDLGRARRVLRVALPALRGRGVRAARGSLSEILAEPDVAALAVQAAPGEKGAFLSDYQAAIHTLRAVEAGHHVRMHLPGGKGDPELAQLARELGAEDAAFAVVLPLSTPRPVVAAAQRLSEGAMRGVTRLWLDPLMAGKPGAEKKLKAALRRRNSQERGSKRADDGAMADLRTLTEFRDHGAVRVVSLGSRPADLRVARTAKRKLRHLSLGVAGKLVRKDFYADARIEGPFKPVLIGMGVANGIDIGAHVAHVESASLNVVKAAAVDIVDEGANASQSLLELIKNKASGVWGDFGASVTVGVGSVVALATPMGGPSVLSRMMDPSTPMVERVFLSAVYGVGSSMSALAMATLPSRHRVKPILELVEEGFVEHPLGRNGKPLEGAKLGLWARKQALTEHQSYKAQRGSVHGAWGSGVVGAAFGALGWPLKNLSFPLTGGGEGGINGVYQIQSEKHERAVVSRRADRELAGRLRKRDR